MGIKAAAVIGGLADGLSETVVLPVLRLLGMKRQTSLPISKQFDPIIGVDTHLENIPPATSVPMPRLHVGFLMKPENFMAAAISSYPIHEEKKEIGDADPAKLVEIGHTALTMAVGMLCATVKLGGFILKTMASTPIHSIPHVPMKLYLSPIRSLYWRTTDKLSCSLKILAVII
ncbi:MULTISPECIES: hypothetical protein [Bacteroidaceae]|uniref:hypothetical protein n=1 Tax=Bacteroidaceae TaxID=815 RepID=UPI00195DC7EE|nr:hypothetical protein [Phocaeicola barnesiae]MBM6671174.1 hypothetical protein [Phocaeicola coprophilus]MBM6721081.1 hypothetical protein [Bacteroides gallinaceum]MBM6781674.1 hypothetical protein [Bacteroides mediterraneensis]